MRQAVVFVCDASVLFKLRLRFIQATAAFFYTRTARRALLERAALEVLERVVSHA